MNQDEFTTWMDKQMAFYRASRVPFIAYLWVENQTGRLGGMLIRIDLTYTRKDDKELKHELSRAICRLMTDATKQVFIYQG